MSSKRAQKTKTEILDAAWELVAARGAEVSMAEIAKAVGISRQAVYLHFNNRAGLLEALVIRADERFGIIDSFQQALQHADPEKRLKAMFSAWFDFVEKVLPVASDLIRLQDIDADAAIAWQGRMQVLYREIQHLSESLLADNALGEGWSVRDASDYMFSSASMQVWDLMTNKRGCSPERAKSILCGSIYAALSRPLACDP